jgi:hypothetical protein
MQVAGSLAREREAVPPVDDASYYQDSHLGTDRTAGVTIIRAVDRRSYALDVMSL